MQGVLNKMWYRVGLGRGVNAEGVIWQNWTQKTDTDVDQVSEELKEIKKQNTIHQTSEDSRRLTTHQYKHSNTKFSIAWIGGIKTNSEPLVTDIPTLLTLTHN